MMRLRWVLPGSGFALVVALVALAPRAARAQTAAVFVDADDAKMAGAVADAAEAALIDHTWIVATPHGRVDGAEARLRACAAADDACRRDALSAIGAELALVIDLGEADGDGRVVLTGRVIATATGAVALTERWHCERCWGPEPARTAARQLVGTLVRGMGAAPERRARLIVRSTPPGGGVRVDGVAVGVTPLEYGVYPGRHTVTVDKAGYELAVREVAPTAGHAVDVDVVLAPVLTPGDDRRRFGAWSYVAMGTGAAALAAGVVLVAIDGPRIEDGERQLHERSTMPAGITAMAAGAGLAALGGYLWWPDRADADDGVVVGASVAPGGGGMVVIGGVLP